jgi:hypothetical protein
LQIGLWPKNLHLHSSFATEMIEIAQNNKLGRIEWAGQASKEQESVLKNQGFRSSFLNRKTWRNALFSDNSSWPLMHRLHFDT